MKQQSALEEYYPNAQKMNIEQTFRGIKTSFAVGFTHVNKGKKYPYRSERRGGPKNTVLVIRAKNV
jgi:hypothetical protein